MNVAIIGGGIAGLTTALFLHQTGIKDVTVFEQTPQIQEAGAGVIVSPNMTRLLEELNLGAPLRKVAVPLHSAWEFLRWDTGKQLFAQHLLDPSPFDAGMFAVHRGDLARILFEALPEGVVRLDRRFVGVDQDGDAAQVSFVDGTGRPHSHRADVVIGADGIFSRVRQALFAHMPQPHTCGLRAIRALVPAERASPWARRPVQTVWTGPGGVLVHYPISAGNLINVIGIVQDADASPGGPPTIPMSVGFPHDGWADNASELIAAAGEASIWDLYQLPAPPSWSAGRVVLVGDAAHATTPFLAQGAAQAVESAQTLAHCLRNALPEGSIRAALEQYEALRRVRTDGVRTQSAAWGRLLMLRDGPDQQKRDAALSRDIRQAMAWLYPAAPGPMPTAAAR